MSNGNDTVARVHHASVGEFQASEEARSRAFSIFFVAETNVVFVPRRVRHPHVTPDLTGQGPKVSHKSLVVGWSVVDQITHMIADLAAANKDTAC